MDFFQQIKTSIFSYWRTFRFIDEHNLWRLLILPAILNLIIAIVIIVMAIKLSRNIVEGMMSNFRFAEDDQELHSLYRGFLMVVIRAGVFFFFLKVFRYLTLVLMSPIFVMITSRVQTIACGHAGRPDALTYLKSCLRGTGIATKNFIIEIILSTLILSVSFIAAWIAPIAPLAILGIESYFMGYTLADYRNNHHHLSARESHHVINQYPGLIIGNGLCFNLFLLIPLIGILFAPVFALTSSGLAINLVEKRKSILCNSDQSIHTTES
jgi:CysZ protein